MGHFEERSPKLRKLVKFLVALLIVLALSVYFGRTVALTVYGLTLIPILIVHGILLPRKGINGWTGKPKGKYYEFRGWDKNIFNE